MANRQVWRHLSENKLNWGIKMPEAGLSQSQFGHVLGGILEFCYMVVESISTDWKCFTSARCGGRVRSTTQAQD